MYSNEIKRLRLKMLLTQDKFAQFLGVSLKVSIDGKIIKTSLQ